MLVRQLTKQLSTSLNTALSGVAEAITRVLVDLSPTSNGFYSLNSSFIAASDHTVECDFYASSFASRVVLVGNTDAGGTFIRINSATEIIFHIVSGVVVTVTLSQAIPANKLSKIKTVLVGSNLKIFLNGVLVGQGTVSGTLQAANYNVIGQKGGVDYFDGIISNVKFKDTVTLSNKLDFALNKLTANTETNNGVTLTYNNIGTANTIRDTYTLSADGTQLISDLRTIDIAAQA